MIAARSGAPADEIARVLTEAGLRARINMELGDRANGAPRQGGRHTGDNFEESAVTDEREERIRTRAYELWEQEGRPEGDAERHWAAASREIASEAGATSEAGAENGDAPAKSVPDNTAVNTAATAAEAKQSRKRSGRQ